MAVFREVRAWTENELEHLRQWNEEGVDPAEMGIRIGRTTGAVQSRLDRMKYTTSNTQPSPRMFAASLGLIEDRDRRADLRMTRTDTTANFFGDPLPGYSALDRRRTG